MTDTIRHLPTDPARADWDALEAAHADAVAAYAAATVDEAPAAWERLGATIAALDAADAADRAAADPDPVLPFDLAGDDARPVVGYACTRGAAGCEPIYADGTDPDDDAPGWLDLVDAGHGLSCRMFTGGNVCTC